MSVAGRCAVIGAGNLGAPVCERLLARGHDLTACDRDPEKLRALAAKGAKTTTAAGDCAGHDRVLVLVTTGPQLGAVADEIARTRAGRSHETPAGCLAVMSTVPARAVYHAAGTLAAVGMRVVDAPVSGGAQRALAGQLTVMAGGAAEDIEALAPVFASLATNVFHCGGIGAGQAVKIVNNILCHANTALTGEAFRLGMALGLRREDMARVMEVSSGRNWLTASPTLAAETLAHHTGDRAVYAGILSILRKDMAIAADLALEQDAAFPMIAGIAKLIDRLGDETWDNWRAVAGTQD